MKNGTKSVDWSWRTLNEVAAQVPHAIVDGPFGSNLKLSDYVSEGVPVLQGKNITNDAFRWFDVRFISHRKAQELKRSSVREGDVLIVKIGSIGYSGIIRDLHGFPFAIIPANLAKVTPNRDIIDTKFLHRWLTSPAAKNSLISAASKTAQPALSLTKIKELQVPVPPLAEQKRIAALLDAAEALRERRRQAIAKVDSLLQSVFYDIFGDPSSNPKKWPVVCLSEIINKGPQNGLYKPAREYGSGTRILRIDGFYDGAVLNPGSLKRVRVSQADESLYGLQQDDVVINRVNSLEYLGKSALIGSLSEPTIFESNIMRFGVDHSRIHPKYLIHFLQTPFVKRQILQRAKNAVNQSSINQQDVGDFRINLPPLQLQREFAKRWAAIEVLRTCHNRCAARLDSLFTSLQQRAFRREL